MDFLHHFETNKTNDLTQRCVYIHGYTGVGKSHLISSILKQLNYDPIQFDAGDVRNKSMIEMLNTDNLSDANIIGIFNQTKKKSEMEKMWKNLNLAIIFISNTVSPKF